MKKIIFKLLFFTSYPFTIPEELVYNVKIFGLQVGIQKIKITEHSERTLKITSFTKTNPFFSKFYKVNNYIETIVEKETFAPFSIKEILSEKESIETHFNYGLEHRTFTIPSLIYYIRKNALDIGTETVFIITKGKKKEIWLKEENKKMRIGRRVYEGKVFSEEGWSVFFSKDEYIPFVIEVKLKSGHTLEGILKR